MIRNCQCGFRARIYHTRHTANHTVRRFICKRCNRSFSTYEMRRDEHDQLLEARAQLAEVRATMSKVLQ